jgi:hypothetical protein
MPNGEGFPVPLYPGAERFAMDEQPVNYQFPACLTCARKHAGLPTCQAFPLGIPDEILDGSNRHNQPVEGDHGLTYLPLMAS